MSNFNNQILVPIDFSEQSFIALSQSYNLARLSRADIVLIHIIDDSSYLPFFTKKEDKELEKKVQEELDKLAAETTKTVGVKVHTLIRHGKIYEEIQSAAKELNCSFIVMGTNGSVGIKRFIGSNALRVIREAPCPVISIKGKVHRTGCKHIVLPLDATKETKEKVKIAIEFASLFGSSIQLVTVLTTDDEFIVNKLKRQMKQVYDHVREHNISCTLEFILGDDIAQEVIQFADKNKSDLIMIMTQEEVNWTDLMFIGSSAQEIINGTDIPVLSIRPKPRKDTSSSPYEF
ncbi:MAG TPA: universal stress protein [Bacteroidia bacterium]|nr:universal stress protein [Bacteroidia bacterium]HNS11168.1 universal stress protein [Bacteroidia bacterium]